MDFKDKNPFRSTIFKILSDSIIGKILSLFFILFIMSAGPSHAGLMYYSIQVGAYKDQNNAVIETNRLKKMGYDVFIRQVKTRSNQLLYLVYVERFSSRFDAERHAQQIKSAGVIQEYLIREIKSGSKNDTVKSYRSQKDDLRPTSSSNHRADPESEKGSAYYDFAVFAFEDGDYQQAEENLKKALALNPHNAVYNHYLGKTYLKWEHYEEAGEYFQDAWDINPNMPELKYDLAFLNFKTGNYPRAADLFAQISQEKPSNVLAHYYAGISFYKQEKYREALGYFLDAAEKSPSIKTNGYYYAGLCYLKDGQTEKAAEMMRYVQESAESELLRNNAANWLMAIVKQRGSGKRYSLYLKTGFGYDSNVPLEPLNQNLFADEDDYFFSGYFSGNYDIVRQPKYRIGAGFSQYQRSYTKLTDYDLTGSIFNLYGIYLFRPFSFSLGYVPTYYWLGYDSYLRSYQLIPELNWRVNKNLYSSLTYRYAQNKYFQNSDLDGYTNDVSGNVYYSLNDNRASIFGGGGYEANNASSSDQDYGLWTAKLGVSFLFPWKLASSVTVRYIDKRFENVDSYYGVQRHDKKYGGTINLCRELYFDWLGIDFQFDYMKSDSNIDDYDYKRSVYTLSLKANF